MNMIHTILNSSVDSIRKSFRRFPLTQSAIAILVILTAFSSNFFDEYVKFNPIDHVALPFLHLTVLGFFYVESSAFQRKAVKIASLILVIGVAVLYVLMGAEVNTFGWGEPLLSRAASIFAFVAIFYVCLAVYALIKQSNLSIDTFAARIYAHGFAAVIVLGVLSMGIVLVALIIQVLFLPGHFNFVMRVWVFCAMTSFSVGFFYAVESLSHDGAKFFASIAKYVLLPVLAIAFVIIYGYIGKIIVTRIMPSNEVFPILSALFIVGMPIWTINRDFLSDEKARKLNDGLAPLFLPFIALQAFSLGIRIKDYGLTPSRYFGVALIVLELVYFALVFFRARRTEPIFLASALIACIAFAVPGINAQDLSRQQQFKTLQRYQEDSSAIDPDDYYRVVGGYTYLLGNDSGRELIDSMDKKTVEKIRDLPRKYSVSFDGTDSFFFYSNNDGRIPVEGYKYVLSGIKCSKNSTKGNLDLSGVYCYQLEHRKSKYDWDKSPIHVMKLNLQDLFLTLFSVKNAESQQLPIEKIEFPNGDVFWIDYVFFDLDADENVVSFEAEGLLLVK